MVELPEHVARVSTATDLRPLRISARPSRRSTTAHQNLAEALRKLGALTGRRWKSYRGAGVRTLGFALAYAGMGTALFEATALPPTTLAALEQALALQPELAERGALRLFMGRAGLESMQRALELDPELPVAAALHLFMGRASAELGDAAAAAAQYESGAADRARATRKRSIAWPWRASASGATRTR